MLWFVSEQPSPDRFLRALRRQAVDRTPVWFMRQAGRYLPEFANVRGAGDILEVCRDPARVTELTLQPLRRMPVDAAILFSDIMVPLASIGVPIRVEPGQGPMIDRPIRRSQDLERLRRLEPETDEPHVLEAIRLLRKELEVPLIGFAGAPFTLASYLIEGGPSRSFSRTRALLMGEPALWDQLMRRLTEIALTHLRAQANAGAQVLQIFDSWVGTLSLPEYRRAVQPHMSRLFEGLTELEAPTIHFGVGTGDLLGSMADAGGDAVGVDWRTPLDIAWERIGPGRAIQGNLDPAALLAPWEVVEARASEVLEAAAGRNGHVFNLGHGVLPETPVENVQRLVELVHSRTAR
jgi:uroporphyrinogen decarboxylase